MKKYLLVYALKLPDSLVVQPNQEKSSTIVSAYNIEKKFYGTTRIMEYEELHD